MRAALFDLDGTLVDSERLNVRALAAVLAALGRPLADDEADFVIGHGWSEIARKLDERTPVGLSLPELMRRSAEERHRIVEAEGEAVLPGAREAVRLARSLGRVAVVSGSSRAEIDKSLDLLGLRDIVELFIGAEDVQAGKPSPEGYLKAAARFDLPASSCIVFEDSTAGLRAARAAAMHGVGVEAGNFARQDQSAAVEIIPSLAVVDEPWLIGRWERRRA